MDEKRFNEYRELVERFRHADLSDPASLKVIAAEQQANALEWAYGKEIPTRLWTLVTEQYQLVDQPAPKHLGEAANWILDRLRKDEERRSGRQSIYADSQERLLSLAKEFYADVVAQETAGVGGFNALVSCSLERYPWDGPKGGYVTLLNPDVLGLRVVAAGERPDDLIDALRRGELVADRVVGGHPSSATDSKPEA